MDGLDRWITSGRYERRTETVYCGNPACVDYKVATTVDYESEYGAGWFTPEECPACGQDWREDEPEDDGEVEP